MKLRLKSAKGVKAGPELTWTGADEIEIDFTGKTGLIAFDGENGSGKSSVLECLHHYPQLVSRGGALWSHFLGRDAEKEFECDFMGSHYRSLIKMDSEQGKQEGFLWVNGRPICNGKITQYKEMVNEIFGQPFTYFRSQFCPQKSKNTQGMQIENMTAGVFRELLQQFLNLQRYAQWEDTAKQAGNILQGQIAGIDQRIRGLEETAGGKESTLLDFFTVDQERIALGDKLGGLRGLLVVSRENVDTLKSTIQQNALALARRADIQQQIDRLNGELLIEKAAADTDIEGYAVKYRETKTAIGGVEAVLREREAITRAAENVQDLESGLTGLVATVEEENQSVPVYQKRCHDLETQIAQLRQQVKDLESDPENTRLGKLVEDAEREVTEKVHELSALDKDPESIRIKQVLAHTEADARVGDGIDADCKSTTCAAIKNVRLAQESLPVVRAALNQRQAEVTALRDEIVASIESIKRVTVEYLAEKGERVRVIAAERALIETQIKTLTHDLGNAQQVLISTNELLTMHRAKLSTLRQEIAKQKALADRLPEIKIAEQRKADLEKQLQDVTAAGTARRVAWEAKAKEIDDTLQFHLGAWAAYRIDETVEQRLSQAQGEITHIEAVKIPSVEKEIQAAREKIATLQAELSRIEAAEKELQEAKIARDSLAIKVSRWRYLQLGCGKTGLQNLRIDGAAPRIIYNANRLLSQAYGARYAVRLETQNDQGKEDLQIKIIMENGQEVYLDDISGGQRAWNVQALWLAMSLLNQEKSGRKYDYFCSDESDGALDVENAEKYTALYRPFMAEAGLSRLLMISHKESCRAMADHVLQFQHGEQPSWN